MNLRSAKRRVMKLFNRRFCEYIYLSAEDRAWDNMAPVGREYGSPDFERLQAIDYQADDGPITEKQLAALREDAAKHMPKGKTVSILHLFDAVKDSADRASTAIEESLKAIEESNLRIAAMENASQDADLARTVLSRMGERSHAIEVDIDTGLPVTKI